MSSSNNFSKPGRVPPSSPAAQARLAQALRENLQRRKAQARGKDQAGETAPDSAAKDEGGVPG